MAKLYFTVAGCNHYFGTDFMEKGMTVTLSSQINFLGAARGSTLTAEARVIKEGGSTTFYSVEVTDELGTQIAVISSNGYLIRRQ